VKKGIKALKFATIMALLLGSFFSVTDSFAYWNNGTVPPDTATGTVTTSTWVQYFDWNVTATYAVGDIVFHNGSYWIATKAGTNSKEPTLGKPGSNWWSPYTP